VRNSLKNDLASINWRFVGNLEDKSLKIMKSMDSNQNSLANLASYAQCLDDKGTHNSFLSRSYALYEDFWESDKSQGPTVPKKKGFRSNPKPQIEEKIQIIRGSSNW